MVDVKCRILDDRKENFEVAQMLGGGEFRQVASKPLYPIPASGYESYFGLFQVH